LSISLFEDEENGFMTDYIPRSQNFEVCVFNW
jgi:hypothetical protein